MFEENFAYTFTRCKNIQAAQYFLLVYLYICVRNIGFYARVNHGGHIQVFVASQMETLFNVPLPACILLKVRQDTGRCKPSVAANPNGFGATLNHIRFSPV